MERTQSQVEKYTHAVADLRHLDEPLKLAHAVRHLGDAYRRAGNLSLAEPCYVEALSIYRSREDRKPLDLANAIRGFAILKQGLGETRDAEELWLEAHQIYKSLNVLSGVAGSAARLALVAQQRGDPSQSKQWLSIAIEAADNADDAEVLEHVREIRTQLERGGT